MLALDRDHGGRFVAEVLPFAGEVVERSTWAPDCPVAQQDLAHLVVSFWGFDDEPHVGELVVHADVADDLTGVDAVRRPVPHRGPGHRRTVGPGGAADG